MKYPVLIFLLLFGFSAKAQTQHIRYFTKSFQTREPQKTNQKRIYFEEKNSIRFEDFQDEKPDLKGVINGAKSLEQAEKYLWYLRSGLDMNYQTEFDPLYGDFINYRSDGTPFEAQVFRGKHIYYSQAWNKEGHPVLINGTGSRDELAKDGESRILAIFKDSVLESSYSIRLKENDTIYQKMDQIAAPKEGYEKFIPELAKVIGYPVLAQWTGKEGLVYISFIVDKQGKLTEIKPKSNQGYRMETKALKQLAKLPAWSPAYFQQKPVKSMYTLPIRYKLE